jgi:cysteinyl-tRNA synthetase
MEEIKMFEKVIAFLGNNALFISFLTAFIAIFINLGSRYYSYHKYGEKKHILNEEIIDEFDKLSNEIDERNIEIVRGEVIEALNEIILSLEAKKYALSETNQSVYNDESSLKRKKYVELVAHINEYLSNSSTNLSEEVRHDLH